MNHLLPLPSTRCSHKRFLVSVYGQMTYLIYIIYIYYWYFRNSRTQRMRVSERVEEVLNIYIYIFTIYRYAVIIAFRVLRRRCLKKTAWHKSKYENFVVGESTWKRCSSYRINTYVYLACTTVTQLQSIPPKTVYFIISFGNKDALYYSSYCFFNIKSTKIFNNN